MALLLGISPTVAQQAAALDRWMKELGITNPCLNRRRITANCGGTSIRAIASDLWTRGILHRNPSRHIRPFGIRCQTYSLHRIFLVISDPLFFPLHSISFSLAVNQKPSWKNIMSALVVGRPYPGLNPPLKEGAKFNLHSGGAELSFQFWNLNRRKVQDMALAPCEFALVERPMVFFLLYRFGESFPWSDVPYTVHLVPPDRKPGPQLFSVKSNQLLLNVTLLHCPTATLKVLRAVSLSRAFFRTMGEMVQRQSRTRWPGSTAYHANLAKLYHQFPDTTGLLRVATVRCHVRG